MLDVQKAFDSVDHTMLCEKIRLLGIEPDWFQSYLFNRKQTVSINNVLSSEQTIQCGVPQGSILGPWCYLVYSNDISTCVSCKLLMYADDTILLSSHKDLSKVSSELSKEVSNCYHWLCNNKLSMHMGKTEVIVLSSKRKRHLTKNVSIQCHNDIIKSTNTVKYLGLTIDQTLSGEPTVYSILNKCTARLKFMFRHCNALDVNCRKLLYSALVQCHFDYAASAWYMGISQYLKRRLQTAQNKAVRFILNLGPRTHVGQSERNMLGYLNTNDRVQQLMSSHMFNIFNDVAPSYLGEKFVRVGGVHRHNTRNSEFNVIVPRVQGPEKYNFSYQGVKVWNDLPSSIKGVQTKSVFKEAIKQYYINRTLSVESSEFIYY